MVREHAERAGVTIDKVAKGRGCSSCNQVGLKGRSGLYEVLDPDDEFRSAVASGGNLGVLRKLAKKQGMKTLFEYGMQKVSAGETTIDEVLRVTAS